MTDLLVGAEALRARKGRTVTGFVLLPRRVVLVFDDGEGLAVLSAFGIVRERETPERTSDAEQCRVARSIQDRETDAAIGMLHFLRDVREPIFGIIEAIQANPERFNTHDGESCMAAAARFVANAAGVGPRPKYPVDLRADVAVGRPGALSSRRGPSLR